MEQGCTFVFRSRLGQVLSAAIFCWVLGIPYASAQQQHPQQNNAQVYGPEPGENTFGPQLTPQQAGPMPAVPYQPAFPGATIAVPNQPAASTSSIQAGPSQVFSTANPPATGEILPLPQPSQLSRLTESGTSAWTLMAQIRQLVKSGKVRNALPLSDEFIRLKPQEPEGYFWQGVIFDNLDEPQAALARFERATQQDLAAGMDSAEVRLNTGNVLLKLGRTDEAITQYRRAHLIDPELPLVDLNLGRAFIEKGQFEDALKCLARCDELHFNSLQVAYYRCKALQRAGRIEDAKTEANNLLGKLPDNDLSRGLRGEFAALLQK